MQQRLRVLLIAGDEKVCALVQSTFQSEGHEVICTADPLHIPDLAAKQPVFDAVFFDTTCQPIAHLHLLQSLAHTFGAAKLWLIVSMGLSPWRAEGRICGVAGSFNKPLQRHDLQGILRGEPLDEVKPSAPVKTGTSPRAGSPYVEELAGGGYFLADCPAMMEIYQTVRLLAPVEIPVLILGESGAGKDVVAKLLHKHSLRANDSFSCINCAALPADLLESELFGYEAGAFTGALKAKPGKFELANKGTILLDEIGEMATPMQAKLLHVLQDGRYSRLGSRSSTQADVRVIAATNINIEEAIEQGTFREDLYYRISAFTIQIPPLRHRREEIPALVREMLRRQTASLRLEPQEPNATLIEAMQEYDWPGNLRELSNFVSRILILRNQDVILSDLRAKLCSSRSVCRPGNASRAHEQVPADDMRSAVRLVKDRTESRFIQEALEASGWNRRRAAAQLQISYRGLLYKIQHYQLKETAIQNTLAASVTQGRLL